MNDFSSSIVYCYIVYFQLVLARKNKFTIFFAFTSHKVFKLVCADIGEFGMSIYHVLYDMYGLIHD